MINPIGGMNSHYFGAKFGENIVVFENMDYGNAIYILSDNWEEISKMSRIDDYITLNVPPRAFSNVPLQIWSR